MSDIGCSQNAMIAFDYLVGKGLRDFQAAAVIGNLQWESGLNPARAVMDTNKKVSRGIAMWQPERWQNLLTFADGRDPLSLGTQLDFLWSELPAHGLDSLLASTRPEDAVVVFQNRFEAPKANLAHTDKRIALTQRLLDCLSIKPPLTQRRIGVVAATASILGIVTVVGYGIYRALAGREPPEPDFTVGPMSRRFR
jgi:hypothetical protein